MTVLPYPVNHGWPIDWEKDAIPAGADPDLVSLAEMYAATTMRMLTLYRVGGLPVTVYPCGNACRSHTFAPSMFNGVLYNVALCQCRTGCGCGYRPTVELVPPVGRIDIVIVEGEVVDSSAYRVDNGNKLVRTDGGVWPMCSSDGFTVTYVNGYDVDAIGARAAGILAAEYLKSLTGGRGCRLPANITGLTRQGVSLQITTGLFPGGFTGIPEVDAYIRQWNPNGLTQAPTVSSVDTINRPGRTTWRP